MGASFFVRRYVLVLVLASVVISLAQYLKGHTVAYSVREGLTWGAIASLVYTSVLAYKLRHLRAAAGPGGTNGSARKVLGVVLLLLGAIMLFWGGMILVTLVNRFVDPSGSPVYVSGQLVGRGIAGVLFVLLVLRALSGGRRRLAGVVVSTPAA